MPPDTHKPPLAFLSALPQELDAVLQSFEAARQTRLAGRLFHTGRLHGQTVVAAISGIGKVAAAATTALLLERFAPRALVFTGVAGGLGPGVKVGDVVVASHCLQHDLDGSPIVPRYEIPGQHISRLPTAAALTAQLAGAAQAAIGDVLLHLPDAVAASFGMHTHGDGLPRLHQGLLISGDRFVATAAESRQLQAELPDALAVEMEGAACAQVCRDFDVPFALVRSISDRADDSAHTDFLQFLQQVASPYSACVVRRLLHQDAIESIAGAAVSAG